MRLTAQELATLVNGSLHADPSLVITGVAGLGEAGPADVSFLANPRYAAKLVETRAGIVLVPASVPVPDRPVIAVDNPQLAYARILGIAERDRRPAPRPGIHPSAVVAPDARIGAGVSIGPCAVIEEGAVIGDDTVISAQVYIGAKSVVGAGCLLYPQVTVRENITIGSRVIIHSGTVVGSDGFGFVPGREGHFKIPQIGTVVIGDDVELGANVAIDRATTGSTVIGKGTKIDNLVQVAHNVQIGEHCIIVSQSGVSGSARLGKFVTLGGQSGVVGHIVIGDGVTVAGRGGVIGSIDGGQTVSGFPARPHREDMKIQALVHRLPELFQFFRTLKKNP